MASLQQQEEQRQTLSVLLIINAQKAKLLPDAAKDALHANAVLPPLCLCHLIITCRQASLALWLILKWAFV